MLPPPPPLLPSSEKRGASSPPESTGLRLMLVRGRLSCPSCLCSLLYGTESKRGGRECGYETVRFDPIPFCPAKWAMVRTALEDLPLPEANLQSGIILLE